MATVLHPWQILVAAMAGWITRRVGRNLIDPIDGSLAEKASRSDDLLR
jgi:hypothetical protein